MALEQPDPDVLRRAQRGDERAFALILRAYETPIFNYVYRIVGDRSLAEDLTQEVFVRVFQALPRFSLRCKFTTAKAYPSPISSQKRFVTSSADISGFLS